LQILEVIVAGAASYIFGALWYMVLSKPWVEASGVEVGANGRPVGNAMTYGLAFLAALLVAGMMRHIYAQAGITGMSKGVITGLGLGLFVASPWVMINNAFGGRPFKLTLIDGGYATFGCAVIGLVLTVWPE
jgi:hypothetical protein